VSQRIARIADQIRMELAELFLREVRDPRVQLASVSRVEVSRDLSVARAWISVLGDAAQQAAAMEGLEAARGFLRTRIARRLNLRVTPELKFELDLGAQRLQEMSALLDSLRTPEKDEKGEGDDS
jgi:ribosome-binding factor A